MSEADQEISRRQGFIGKYIFSVDHKVIGLQFFFLALFAVLLGMVLSWMIRPHLARPNLPIPLLGALSPAGAPGGRCGEGEVVDW